MSPETPANSGAYRLTIRLWGPAWLEVGRLGRWRLPAGVYVYIGSARRNLAQRVARHRRLASAKAGNRHWHLDGLLLHHRARLLAAELLPGAEECTVSQQLSKRKGVTIPIPNFGATDCRNGCGAHLYRLE